MPVYGVNLPWLHGSYGHDLAENEQHLDWSYAFDKHTMDQPLREARRLGFSAVRVWLCEGGEGIVTHDGEVVGFNPRLLAHAQRLGEIAAQENLQIYWGLLDANSWRRDGDALTHAILTDPAQTARFAERVAAPLARGLDTVTTFAFEVVNEPEVMTAACAAPGEDSVGWEVLGRAISTIGDAIRAEHPTRVTAGTMHHFLDALWASGARLDAADVHVYHEDGGLPSIADLAAYAKDPRLATGEVPVFGGECGLPHEDTPPHERLAHYLYNAGPSGYAAVFLWRLEGWLIEQGKERFVTHAGKAVRTALHERLREGPA